MFSVSALLELLTVGFFAGLGLYAWYEHKKAAKEPHLLETEEEKKLRQAPPPALLQRDTPSLQRELMDDLKIAQSYIDGVLVILEEKGMDYALSYLTLSMNGGERSFGTEQGKILEISNDVLEIQQHLMRVAHIIEVLEMREDKTVPTHQIIREAGSFRWVLDDPLSDRLVYQELGILHTLLKQAQDQTRAWSLRFA